MERWRTLLLLLLFQTAEEETCLFSSLSLFVCQRSKSGTKQLNGCTRTRSCTPVTPTDLLILHHEMIII